MLFLITEGERQRREGLQLLHDPLGFNFWTAERRQIEHLLQHDSPHAVVKIIVNILSIILPTRALQPAFSMLYIMGVYIIPSTQKVKTLTAAQSMKSICICRMSAPLE